MSNLIAFPKVEWFTVKSNSYYSNNEQISFYPYNSNDWEKTVEKFHIKIPFKLIDRSMGLSTCSKCKATYAGYQRHCTNQVPYVEGKRDGSSYLTTFNKIAFKGDNIWDMGNYYVIESNIKFQDCGQWCSWNLESEFNKQQSFFNFINWLSDCPETDNNWFKEYKDCLPLGTADILEKRIMVQKINQLEMENARVKDALMQIAQRMNQAGAALSFGF